MLKALHKHGLEAAQDFSDASYKEGLRISCLSNSSAPEAHIILHFPDEIIGPEETREPASNLNELATILLFVGILSIRKSFAKSMKAFLKCYPYALPRNRQRRYTVTGASPGNPNCHQSRRVLSAARCRAAIISMHLGIIFSQVLQQEEHKRSHSVSTGRGMPEQELSHISVPGHWAHRNVRCHMKNGGARSPSQRTHRCPLTPSGAQSQFLTMPVTHLSNADSYLRPG